jgi:hypothetical protein
VTKSKVVAVSSSTQNFTVDAAMVSKIEKFEKIMQDIE